MAESYVKQLLFLLFDEELIGVYSITDKSIVEKLSHNISF
jgi:hypothetical protein